jgi:GAF domain-containing protein
MLRAVAGVPLKSGDKIAGVIGMSYLEEGRAFGDSELEVLNRFAQLASIALDNARLFAQTQRRVGELEIINSVSRSLNTQLDTNALVELVGEAIRQTLHMPISYVALYDQQTQLIHFPYWVEGAQRMNVGPFVMGQGLTSVVLRTRQTLLINHDADRITAELGGRHTGGTSVKSYLGVPIPLGDEVIGVLSAQSTEREGLFEEGDVRLLTTIAANVGVAIQNARLFEQEQQRARREQILREVTTQVRKSVDIQTIMRTTVQEVGQVLGRRAFIKLGNGEEQG